MRRCIDSVTIFIAINNEGLSVRDIDLYEVELSSISSESEEDKLFRMAHSHIGKRQKGAFAHGWKGRAGPGKSIGVVMGRGWQAGRRARRDRGPGE